jgi:hypothetical protein
MEVKLMKNNKNSASQALILRSETIPSTGKKVVHLTKMIRIAASATKTFTDCELHLDALLSCKGALILENCTLYYNESKSSGLIVLQEGASLTLKNCEVICRGYDENPFITGQGANDFLFTGCTFKDCTYFLNVETMAHSFTLQDCQLYNCCNIFMRVFLDEEARGEISRCTVTSKELAPFNLHRVGSGINTGTLFSIDSSGAWNVSDVQVDVSAAFQKQLTKHRLRLTYFDCGTAAFTNCTFAGADNCLESVAGTIKNCRFKDCRQVIVTMSSGYDYEDDVSRPTLEDCTFEHCTEVLSLDARSLVTGCQFLNCYDRLIVPENDPNSGDVEIEFCEFHNLSYLTPQEDPDFGSFTCNHCYEYYGSDACINLQYNDDDYFSNQIKNCVFDGVQLGENLYLIQALGNADYTLLTEKLKRSKPVGTVAELENVIFKDCSTQDDSGKIIKTDLVYDTFLSSDVDNAAIYLKNCKGLPEENE